MTVDLVRISKLIALAQAPNDGSDEEAKAAAMAACKMIRDNGLTVYDPKAKSTIAPGTEASTLADLYAKAQDANPVRVAMRQRHEERLRQGLENAKKARTSVG